MKLKSTATLTWKLYTEAVQTSIDCLLCKDIIISFCERTFGNRLKIEGCRKDFNKP